MSDASTVLPYDRTTRDHVLGSVARLFNARAEALDKSEHVERFPLGDRDLRGWIREHSQKARREILAVTHGGAIDLTDYVRSHRLNQELLGGGLKMLSIYDHASAAQSPSLVRFLADSSEVPYLLGFGPVQIKVIDRTEVIVDCPDDGGPRSLLCGTGSRLVQAALAYVSAVRASAVPAAAFADDSGLSPRQHLIAGLLASSQTDEQIAGNLGISVRTVRAEVAQLLRALGVKSRFAAGLRYSQIDPRPGAAQTHSRSGPTGNQHS